jgi:pimeloyl-ACP methyl ester carboxylesterase
MTARRIASFSVAGVVVVYLGYLVALYFNQGNLIFPGTRNRVEATAPHVPGSELLRITTAGGTSDAIFLPAAGSLDSAAKPLLIFGHGNGEVIDYWLSALDGFRERGIGVLLVEYPGYGRSTGVPSEASIRAIMDAAYDRLAVDPRVDRSRIVGFGQSIGGGAIGQLARDRPLRALILLSTFPSLDIFLSSYGAPAFLLRSHFDTLSVVRQYQGPLLVIHGSEDRLIPWQQGQRLADASAHATFKLYHCGHGCWDPVHLPFWQDAVPFLVGAGILERNIT